MSKEQSDPSRRDKKESQPEDENSLGERLPEEQTASEESENDKDSAVEPEILENLPPEVRKTVRETFLGVAGPTRHPVLSKINEGHISTLLEQSGKDDERAFEDKQSVRKYGVFYALLASALFVFLTVYLVQVDLAIYQEVLKIIVVFAGGVGSGFGLKSYLDKRQNKR